MMLQCVRFNVRAWSYIKNAKFADDEEEEEVDREIEPSEPLEIERVSIVTVLQEEKGNVKKTLSMMQRRHKHINVIPMNRP